MDESMDESAVDKAHISSFNGDRAPIIAVPRGVCNPECRWQY